MISATGPPVLYWCCPIQSVGSTSSEDVMPRFFHLNLPREVAFEKSRIPVTANYCHQARRFALAGASDRHNRQRFTLRNVWIWKRYTVVNLAATSATIILTQIMRITKQLVVKSFQHDFNARVGHLYSYAHLARYTVEPLLRDHLRDRT